MFDPKEIERLLRAEFPDGEIEVKDLTGGFDHFEVTVTSQKFEGKSVLEQHRMVYAAIGEAVGGPIHALKIQTKRKAAV